MVFAHTDRPHIVHADNDRLWDASGRAYTDLFGANGACWLGHGRPELVQALQQQAGEAWLLGGLRHDGQSLVEEALRPWLPTGLRLASLASTGMEIAELALRVARVTTGRSGMVGFAGSMHGKSLATAWLGWNNHDGVDLPGWARVPFVDKQHEDAVLAGVAAALHGGGVAAVFVEVMQGSNGAREASTAFYRAIEALARNNGVLLVCDEVLTGFHRTGGRFRFERHDLSPDIVLIGKACGNGFPVSGMLLRDGLSLAPRMLPGSTFAGNPLACAVMAETLKLLRGLDAAARAVAIGRAVQAKLQQLPSGWALRGDGALWILDCMEPAFCEAVVARCYERGVAVGAYGRWLRMLPASTIDPARLNVACEVIRQAVIEVAELG